MDQWACVDAFCFPLQVLLSIRPEWSEYPVAVLERDSPRGRLIELNRQAKEAHLRRGMRYGEALALVPHLRATTVEKTLIEKKSEAVATRLSDFSPRVEYDDDHPGIFWLNISGLEEIFASWKKWVTALKKRLREEQNIYVAVVIGHTRFGTFAIARSTQKSGAFESLENERDAAGKVKLKSLDLPPSALETTERLGIKNIDELLALPAEGLRRRLGEESFSLYRRARGDLRTPRPAYRTTDAPSETDHLDYAETDTNRLLFLIKRNLHVLLEALKKSGEKLAILTLSLHRREQKPIDSDVRPAEPTLDAVLILDLVRLHLEKLSIGAGITDVVLTACGEKTTTEQMHLFAADNPRDISAANRALARLRAEFGADAILKIAPKEGHLPESRFELLRLEKLHLPDRPGDQKSRAVRRFFPTPMTLERHHNTPVRAGPHTISGGWWVRKAHRDYQLVEFAGNRLLWIFYDHRRKQWYVHGEY